jgi:hypothetical protein
VLRSGQAQCIDFGNLKLGQLARTGVCWQVTHQFHHRGCLTCSWHTCNVEAPAQHTAVSAEDPSTRNSFTACIQRSWWTPVTRGRQRRYHGELAA